MDQETIRYPIQVYVKPSPSSFWLCQRTLQPAKLRCTNHPSFCNYFPIKIFCYGLSSSLPLQRNYPSGSTSLPLPLSGIFHLSDSVCHCLLSLCCQHSCFSTKSPFHHIIQMTQNTDTPISADHALWLWTMICSSDLRSRRKYRDEHQPRLSFTC